MTIALLFCGTLAALATPPQPTPAQQTDDTTPLRAVLHPSLQDFARHVAYLETVELKLWLDQTRDGDLRFASWPRSQPLSATPERVLTGGTAEVGADGEPREYSFHGEGITYRVSLGERSTSTSPSLVVRQGESPVLEQAAQRVDTAAVVADPAPGPTEFTPTGRETLSAYKQLPPGRSPEDLAKLLAEHDFLLLSTARRHGPDPTKDPALPPSMSDSSTWTIGACSTVEAYWILATYTRADWLPSLAAESVAWRDQPGHPTREMVVLNDPDNPSPYFGRSIYAYRDKASREILEYLWISESEGGVSEVSMKKKDGYTWTVSAFDLAD